MSIHPIQAAKAYRQLQYGIISISISISSSSSSNSSSSSSSNV
jgi:hypothetical protein